MFKLKTEGQIIYRKPDRKVAKLKWKFSLIVGWLNRALNNPTQELHLFMLNYLVLEVRNWSRHLKVFFQSTLHSCQKVDSNPNMAQGHERNERGLVLPPQYEIGPGILRFVDQPLSFPVRCSSIVVLHLGCYELKIHGGRFSLQFKNVIQSPRIK